MEELKHAMYGTRLLVFIEDEPQSNKYRQVLLDADEFKKVSMNVGKVIGKCEDGLDKVEVHWSDELYDLPDLREIN